MKSESSGFQQGFNSSQGASFLGGNLRPIKLSIQPAKWLFDKQAKLKQPWETCCWTPGCPQASPRDNHQSELFLFQSFKNYIQPNLKSQRRKGTKLTCKCPGQHVLCPAYPQDVQGWPPGDDSPDQVPSIDCQYLLHHKPHKGAHKNGWKTVQEARIIINALDISPRLSVNLGYSVCNISKYTQNNAGGNPLTD